SWPSLARQRESRSRDESGGFRPLPWRESRPKPASYRDAKFQWWLESRHAQRPPVPEARKARRCYWLREARRPDRTRRQPFEYIQETRWSGGPHRRQLALVRTTN